MTAVQKKPVLPKLVITSVRVCDRIGCRREGSIRVKTVLPSSEATIWNYLCPEHASQRKRSRKA